MSKSNLPARHSRPESPPISDNMSLTADQIAAFALTLSKSDHIGDVVKNIEFYPVVSPCPQDYHQLPDDVDKYLDIILQHVPNLERISSPWSAFEINHILKSLQVTHYRLKYLKSLPFLEGMTYQDRNLYALLALNFKDSLTKLSLIPHSGNPDFILLKANMKNFKSLEQLQLCGSSVEGSIIAEVDDLVSKCHETTRVLELDQCNLSSNTEQVNPNNSIKTLLLSDSTVLSASAIQYFANKLAALETLAITATCARPSQNEEETLDWWDEMTNLCQRVQSYNISIPVGTRPLDQITHWATITNTIASTASQQEGSTIEIDRDFEKITTKKNSSVVRLKQRDSCVCIFYSKGNAIFRKIAKFEQTLQPYLPSAFAILNVEQTLCSEFLLKGIDFEPQGDYSKSWEVFDVVVSLTKNKPDSVVHLNKMMLTEPKSTDDDGEQLGSIISELKFSDSIIQSNAFPKMSLKLSKIGTLILDGCVVLGRPSLYQLEICFPGTELCHLKLNLSCMFRFGSPERRTIVVKTATAETTTYEYIKDEDRINDQQVADTIGSNDNFVIRIVCKELQSWDVTGMKPEEEWKQQKVEAAPIIKSLE